MRNVNKNDVTIISGLTEASKKRLLHISECMKHIKSYNTRTYAHQIQIEIRNQKQIHIFALTYQTEDCYK